MPANRTPATLAGAAGAVTQSEARTFPAYRGGGFESIHIGQLWAGLGGGPIRHGRARAFWRNGDNATAVSIDLERGRWRDHVSGTGGGCLALVETVLSCSRAEALRWLEQNSFIEPRRLSVVDRRQFAQRRAVAEDHARDGWRWWQARRWQLEAWKAAADALEDYGALAAYARALVAHESIEPGALVAAYQAARAADRAGVATLIGEAIGDERRWDQLDRLVLEGIRRTGGLVGVAA
ncbi:MAG: hypothetical protein NTV70_10175 [Acidobacteria bacterium]|nr:hypothetical protein [Acidobacteriota bacterium]